MKKKYLLFGGAGVAVVAAAVLLILLLTKKGESYRTILVLETKGDVTVQRDGGTISAYQDMRLRNGDGMKVPGSGLARLKLDSDKFVYLEENTTISLQAAGTAADSRTIIYVEEGNMLTEVQQKLSVDSSYDVVTPNTTMAIRGTVTQTIVRKGMADADQAVTEYSGEDGADSKKKTGKERLCWITDIFIYEGSASVTVYNIDGADIVYRNRTLTAGNGIHVVTPVEETAGNDYVRQFQVDDTRVFWGPRDTRPDGQTGKVREATDNLERGLSHISLSYAASYFPKSVNPKDIKGAGGKLDDKSTKTILKSRGEDPDNDVPPTPTPTEPPAETPTPVPSPSEGPTPPEELTPTPEELTPTPDQTTPVPTKTPTQVPGGVTPATNNNENKVSPQTEPTTDPTTKPETEPETEPTTEPTEYTVYMHNYDMEDPDHVETATASSEQAFRLPVLDDNDQYAFYGWLDVTGAEVLSIPAGQTEDVHVYADWQGQEYTATFHNGDDTKEITFVYGAGLPSSMFPAVKSEDPMVEFLFWGENEESERAYGDIPQDCCEDVDLFAVYGPIRFTVTYFIDGVQYTAMPDEYTGYYYGEGFELPPPPKQLNGVAIKGWYALSEENGPVQRSSISNEESGDLSFYAYSEYTITYLQWNGEGYMTETETYLAGFEHTLREGTWYAPGSYGTIVTNLPATATGNKYFYLKQDNDQVTVTFLNNDGTIFLWFSTGRGTQATTEVQDPGGDYHWEAAFGTSYDASTLSPGQFITPMEDLFFIAVAD